VVEVSERPTSRERKIYIAVERRGWGGGGGSFVVEMGVFCGRERRK